MMDLETAARLATASDHPGCPLRLIVEKIAEGERKAKKAEALRAKTVAMWGEFGSRGREMEMDEGDAFGPRSSGSAPSRQEASRPSAPIAIAKE